MRKVVADARADGVDARHEGGVLLLAQHADRDEGLQQLHRDEAGARKSRKRQRAVALAVLEQPVDAADLVDLRVADHRQPLGEQVDLVPVAPPERPLAVNDAVGEPAQRAR